LADTKDPPALPPPEPGRDVQPIAIEEEMRKSYLDYAMSVIVSRAIPDARDGLKPVHRRIVYAMQQGGYTHDKPFKKAANVVGDVMGRYHPHGDVAIYDALVRMAQPWSMSLMLIEGQGNFGSLDGDPPAAMRYTECRLDESASFLVADIDKDTVDFQDNYDGSRQEPVVLPARFPNLLVNGAGGIAVGMATNIPPHNLGEIVDATVAMIDDPGVSDADLLEIVPGPDFPTGALIVGRSGARLGLATGRGSVMMRGRTEIEELRSGRMAIIVSEVPYQVNKAGMVEKISELVRDKRVEGIAEMRDESDRDGVRVVIELKRDAVPDVVLNQLYRFSPLQTSFGVNMLALNGGRPEVLTLRSCLQSFIIFREEVVARRTKHDLAKARDRAHVLVGLAVAVANIDEVIETIRRSPDPGVARERLRERTWPAKDMGALIALVADPRSVLTEAGEIHMTDEQARAILALQLSRLTGLGRDELGDEAKGLAESIKDYLDILRSRPRIMDIIKKELAEVRDKFAVPRRTAFLDVELEIDDESLITREDMVVTVTRGGYVKRTALAEYRTQRRGGKGRSGMSTKEEDVVTRVFVASTHAPLLCFSSAGMVYKLKVWRLPQGDPRTRGKAFINLLPLEQGATITNVMALPEDEESWADLDVMFATRRGSVRRNKLGDFTNVNRAGKIAMKCEEGDAIVGVQTCSAAEDVLLTTVQGMCIRFPVSDVRVFAGRTSTGVRGVNLQDDDQVISMAILSHLDVESAEARAYLRRQNALRRAKGEDEEAHAEGDEEAADAEGEVEAEASLSPERIAQMEAAEQFLITIADDGYGKRSSSFDYRTTGRGGKGLIAHDLSRGGRLVGCFPVEAGDEVLLVTDAGQLLRSGVGAVRIAARNTRGVVLIRLNEGERVVSVDRVAEAGEDDDEVGDED
jgi:DNA gyrase subunit A